MSESYFVLIGEEVREQPAESYDELLHLPAIEAEDDGLVVGPWLTTDEAAWSWNEGPCPCGGVMRWAEAGFVPWHRICDRCGSHWDLHPVVLYFYGGTLCRPVVKSCRQLDSIGVDESGDPYQVFSSDTILAAEGVYNLAIAHLRSASPEEAAEYSKRGSICGGWARRARFYR